MKKIIGIISRPTKSSSNRIMLGVYESYLKCIIKSGGIPLIISPVQNMDYEEINKTKKLTLNEKKDLEQILKLCDGIIMPGGEEIYEYDYFILENAIKNDIPILGICMGMQIMASYKKYNLIPVNNHNLINHKIIIKKDSTLYKIFKKTNLDVNSRHNYQIKDSGIYKIIALSDSVIEGIELDTNTFNIGVQWHPEDIISHQKIFNYFLKIIKKQ